MVGLAAGVGATYFVTRGQLYVLFFIAPMYVMILVLTIIADSLIRKIDEYMEDDEEDAQPPRFAS